VYVVDSDKETLVALAQGTINRVGDGAGGADGTSAGSTASGHSTGR
jgi:hypothetical protein